MLQLQLRKQINKYVIGFLGVVFSFGVSAQIGTVSELNGTPGSIERQTGESLTATLSGGSGR